MILRLEHLYVLMGLVLAAIAVLTARDAGNPRRWTSAAFWGLYAVIYVAGDWLPPEVSGAVMVIMALIAGSGGVSGGRHHTPSENERRSSAERLGNWLFVPALLIPFITLLGSTLLKDVQIDGRFLMDPKNATLISLGGAALIALAVACRLTGATPMQGLRETRRLVDGISWAVVLPHMLAVLGLLLIDAGVGKAVAQIVTSYVNLDSRLVAVAVYCVGMALFTVIMGNGFAAFPVIAGGIGIPVLINVYHANPAVMAAIGMFSAYCGTLMTPMAANFNIVPAALLELPDKNGVIKAQIATALPLLAANIGLLYFLMGT